MRPLPEKSTYNCRKTPVPRPIVVATAAPVMPSSGKGPIPKMSKGSSKILMPLAIHKTRMAITASPAPRKTAFKIKRSMMVIFPPSSIAVYPQPVSTTCSEAPISPSISCGNSTPSIAIGSAINTPSQIDCAAVFEADSKSFSPILRATIAVVPMLIPIAAAKISVITASVTPRAARASEPSRPIKKASTTVKTDSSAISKIMGTDNRSTAFEILPLVKSV